MKKIILLFSSIFLIGTVFAVECPKPDSKAFRLHLGGIASIGCFLGYSSNCGVTKVISNIENADGSREEYHHSTTKEFASCILECLKGGQVIDLVDETTVDCTYKSVSTVPSTRGEGTSTKTVIMTVVKPTIDLSSLSISKKE
jgi:hypothetical protein